MAEVSTPMKFKSITIKSFISDLPNVFNENFSKIADFINSIYDFAKKKLYNITDIEASGTITSNTVKAKNLVISGGIMSDKLIIKGRNKNGEIVDIDLLELKEKVDSLDKSIRTMHAEVS